MWVFVTALVIIGAILSWISESLTPGALALVAAAGVLAAQIHNSGQK